ncbi:thioredoxin 1 [Marininema mesophilum]|uniref:Thioredoxin 1 n=1 Tax=Marininema mesophilum TaxID=1048340 RepID=A0A1H2TQ93_9BACL|nr:thioredoxin family protein [Marininema mesophilum]SDW45938.1 thioredoxin 1 [Marininema mesophilum]
MERLDQSTFKPFISEGVKLVEFSASWCFDCKRIAFSMPEWEDRYGSHFHFGELDVDESRKIAEEFHVKGVPTFILFRDGVEEFRLASKEAKKDENVIRFFDEVSAAPLP